MAHDFYELSGALGWHLRESNLASREWKISTSGQLSLLLNVARTLRFKEAEEILRPLVDQRTNQDGDLMPDDGWPAEEDKSRQ